MKEINLIEENAITLVALIITIIVLVILAAVSINAAFNTGIIDTAVNGAVNYATAQKQEQITFDELDGSLQDILNRINAYDIGGTVPTEKPEPTIEPTPENKAPVFIKQATATNITSKSMTISATATDEDGDDITYIFYWGTSIGTLTKVESNKTGIFFRTGLTGTTKYYFRIDASDGHEITGGTRKDATAAMPNADGNITDIAKVDFSLPNASNVITSNIGKKANYTFDEVEVTISGQLSGTGTVQKYKATNNDTDWYVFLEDNEYIYLIGRSYSEVKLKGVAGFNNGVGLLNAICASAFQSSKFNAATTRNLKQEDLISLNYTFYGMDDKYPLTATNWPVVVEHDSYMNSFSSQTAWYNYSTKSFNSNYGSFRVVWRNQW